LDREIRGGETHAYPVELQAGQFLRVIVQEDGVDLALRLLDPEGNAVTGADSLSRGRAEEKEDLAALAARAGIYRLEVVAAPSRDAGRYTLNVEGPRAAGEGEEARAEAVRSTWTGMVESKGRVEEQIRSLERALPLWQGLQENRKTAEVLYARGQRRLSLLQYGPALLDFQQSATLWAQEPGTAAKIYHAHSLTNVGRCLKNTERREEARQAFTQSLALAREAGDYDLQAKNLDNLGLLEIEAGELRKGVDLQRQALDLVRQAGNRSHEATILNNLADAYDQLAEPQKALQFYQDALNLARGRSNEWIVLNNIGDIYGALGDWERAFEFYKRSAEMSGPSDDGARRGKILINLAGAHRRLSQTEQARKILGQALALGRESQSKEIQTFALVSLAALELDSKRPAEAIKYAREAVALGGSLERETVSRYNLGKAFRDLGDRASAQAELQKALVLAQKRGDGRIETEVDLALARVESDQGNLASALARIQKAIERIESRREGVVSPDLRTSFLASKQDYYGLQIDTLMALHAKRPLEGFAADALRASERARARGLLEILNESGDDIRLGADPTLLAKEREAREELNARDWYRRELLAGGNPDPKRLAEAEQRLEDALEHYETAQVELREGSPRYTALTQPQPLDAAEIQRQVLDGEALLLEYALGSRRSFVWAVGPGSLASFELPGREQIEKTARRYYELLTTRNNRLKGESLPVWKKRLTAADAEAGQAGRELSGLILKPVEKLLGNRPLLIVADGALQYIPFAALPVPSTGVPLATGHEVVSLSSASALAVIRRELRDRTQAPRTLAVFADPIFQKDDPRLSYGIDKAGLLKLSHKTSAHRGDGIDLSSFRRLPFSQKEADTIAALLPPGEVFKAVGFSASRATIENGGLDNYRIVHFATHGVLDSRHPELSGLVLSLYNEKGDRQDGFLRLNDIYNLRLDAELVVLSACRTALGKEIRGEGLVGLTRGFMYAGASRVLASLWSVEDRATAELMGSFYRGMLREGLTPAAALRKAQLEMAKNPRYKSPYFWAGFSLQGEWR
jgi:CHAT domain-containing protein/Tfp pilus assembly protein PilF